MVQYQTFKEVQRRHVCRHKAKQPNLPTPDHAAPFTDPVFIYLMDKNRMMTALAVFVTASLTDIADGWIAQAQPITDFKLFDPLADKLMVLSVMLMWPSGHRALAAICIAGQGGADAPGRAVAVQTDIWSMMPSARSPSL